MKTYVLTLSKVFPATHPRKGEATGFANNLRRKKRHTIRANFPLWKKRFDEIERGEACLSIREWTGKPYRSKQKEIVRLTKEDGIGIQQLSFYYNNLNHHGVINAKKQPWVSDIARNDGLSVDDWEAWFRNYDLSKPLAIIHFTKFRY